jgi:signal peptidase I
MSSASLVCPGETLEIRQGKVFINGNALSEDYVAQEFNSAKISAPPMLIREKRYYVIGDNRDHSSDSRAWGTVAEDLIYGKFLVRY